MPVGGASEGSQTKAGTNQTSHLEKRLIQWVYLSLYPERNKVTAVALGSFPAGEQAGLSLRLGEPLSIVSE